MSELLKCPFCGGEAKPYNLGKKHLIECDDCKEYGHGAYVVARTEAEAIEAWNTRAERTCENIGYYIDSTRFKCSECGYNGWTKWAKDGEDRIPNYCPNCGAKVVSA